MGTTIGRKDIATTGSGHVAVSTPAMSLNPPPPPAGPVPAPYGYTARSATAKKTESKLTVGGHPVLVEGSEMDIDPPANQPSQPTGGDVVTHAVKGKAVMDQGSSRVLVGGKPVCVTGDMVRMNVLTGAQVVAQVSVPLIKAGGAGAAGGTRGGAAAMKKAGKTSGPAALARREVGHPVDVASGHVVDRAVDIALPGSLPLLWRRSYSSGRFKERGPLGRGGWTHSFAQTVFEEPEVITLRAEDGRDIYFAKVQAGESTFHRAERLTLTAERDGRFTVLDHATRTTRVFAPLVANEKAVLRAIHDAFGHTITTYYDNGKRLSEILDAVGRKILVKHDARGRVLRLEVWAASPTLPVETRAGERRIQELALVLWCDYAYHPEGDLASVTDALGHTERFGYDGLHRMVQTTLKNGVSFHYTYDEDTGRCEKTWGDGGELHRCELQYNPDHGTTTVTATNEARRYTWNADGLVVREETFDGHFVRARMYDEDHCLLSEANAAGEKTSCEYDARGNLTKRVDPAGNVTRWEYTGDLPVRRVEPDGLVTVYTHDDRGLLATLLDPEGLSYRLSHDAEGRLQTVYGLDGSLVSFGYDSHGNRAEEIDARGQRTQFAFDALGRPLLRIDALGRRTRVDVDRLGQPLSVHRPDGTSTRAAYDPLGNLAQVTDAFGQVTTMVYAGTGVLVQLTRADGQRWRFTYDDDERLIRIKNPRCEEFTFEYDWAGRLEREKTFDGRNIEYQWSKAERLSRVQYDDEMWRTFGYDPLGNLIEERSPDGEIVFDRDPLGRLTRAVLTEYNGAVVVAFERDRMGRVVAEMQGERTIRYEYDLRGRRSARVLPGGETTLYTYDAAGALAGVDHDGHKIAIARDELGREIHRQVGQGRVNIQSVYDAMDQRIEQRVTSPAPGVLVRRRWGYDEAGRVRQIARNGREGTTHYQYDSIGQLIEASRGQCDEVFEYDPTGSLINALDDRDQVGHVRPWCALPGNLLTRTPRAHYKNDTRGRRVKTVDLLAGAGNNAADEAATTYAWDVRDRLREVRLPGGARVLFTYDAFGRRVRKEVIPAERGDFMAMLQLALEKGPGALPKSQVTEFLWDGDALAAEIAGEQGTRVFVHELGTLVPMLQEEQGAVFTYVTDHLGTPKELVDPEGRIAWAAHHSVWGLVVETWRDPKAMRKVDSPFRLLGQYADPETGLCCTRFRYFDPAVARWLSPDPLGIAGGWNLLAFDGDPINRSDPLGLASRCAHTARAEESSSSFVYQLVDDAGEAVYYGISGNPAIRLGRHAREPPGPFRGMQVISEALPRPQSLALETSLVQQAKAESWFIYNIAESSISATAPIATPPTIQPTHTMLNPALYPR